MAELRALVAVKRVIDFAVKVTGPPSPTFQRPAVMRFRDRERAPRGALLLTSDLCHCSPEWSVTPRDKGQRLRGFDVPSLCCHHL